LRTVDKVRHIHHSIEEWDWLNPERKAYSDKAYISYPTSLRMWSEDMFQAHFCGCLCNVPATLQLAQGELRNNLRLKTISVQPNFWFRAQTPVGDCIRDNCYEVYMWNHIAYFRARVAAAIYDIGNSPYELLDWGWNKIRLKWYNGFTPGGIPCLVLELYSWHYNDWYLVHTFYHEDNLWKDSAINRVGFASTLFYPEEDYEMWWDDTEIWKITP